MKVKYKNLWEDYKYIYIIPFIGIDFIYKEIEITIFIWQFTIKL